MCTSIFRSIQFLVSLMLLMTASAAFAVPLTSGGPGGVGTLTAGTDLVLWLRSDQGVYQDTAGTTPATTSSDPVARWDDLSGWDHHATQADSGRLPALQTGLMNSQPGIQFTNNTPDSGGTLDQFLQTPSFGLAQPVHVFAAFRKTGGDSSNPSIYDGTSAGNSMRLYTSATGTTYNMYAGANLTGGGIPGGHNSFINVTSLFDSTNSTIRANGNPLNSGNAGAGSPNGVTIGGSPFADQDADVDFLEFAAYDRALNSTEIVIVENYLSSRTDVAMVANDHYAGDTIGLGDFDTDVFGVGNDGTSSLSNAGMSGFGIEATVGTSAGQLDSDDWVLAGHRESNNAIVAFESDNPNLVGNRWKRVWYVDKTDDTDNGLAANFGFDFDDAGLNGEFDVDGSYQLLYSPLDDTDWDILDLTPTVDPSGLVTFNLTDELLQSGYFTLGVNIGFVPEPGTMGLLVCGMGLILTRRRRRRS